MTAQTELEKMLTTTSSGDQREFGTTLGKMDLFLNKLVGRFVGIEIVPEGRLTPPTAQLVAVYDDGQLFKVEGSKAYEHSSTRLDHFYLCRNGEDRRYVVEDEVKL